MQNDKSWFRPLWDHLRSDGGRAMRLVVVLACTLITVSIGYAYGRDIWVRGWQLWTWAVCVAITVIFLIPAGVPTLRLGKTWAVLFSLALVALLLRATSLESIPGGLHVDEMGVADFSLRHIFPEPHKTLSPFRTGPVSQPSLYHYLIRLSLALVGNSITGLRISSASAGTLAVLATYAAVAVLENQQTALLGAIVMATYHYHVHWSRIGLNNVWDTLWVPATLAAYGWGWRRRWSGGAVLAGAALGFSQYFYAGSKIGVLLLAYLIWKLWRQEPDKQRLIVHVGKLLLVATCVAAPLVMFIVRDPAPYFERSDVVFGWKREVILEAMGGHYDLLGYAWRQAWRSLGAFTTVPDVTGFYGPGVPLVIGLAAPLFVAGFLWSTYKRRWIPVLWILLTVLLGGFMLTGAPSSSHYTVSIPAICWLIAVPLGWLMEHDRQRLALLALLIVMATDLAFYFAIYVPGGPRDLIHPFPPWPL